MVIWGGTAFAAGPIVQRQARQHDRIHQGVRTGTIDRQELRELRGNQRQIQVVSQHARRDGFVSRREANRIDRMQDRAGRKIYRAKTDRGYPYGHVHPQVRRHGYGHHYRQTPVCVVPAVRPRVIYHRGSHLSGALTQPGFSMAWSVGLD
jgi:hypothetical protein